MRWTCPDCGVEVGQLHDPNCDVARCAGTGEQRLMHVLTYGGIDGCGECGLQEWTGEWPGVAECREYGLYAKLVPGRGWVPCDRDDSDAHEDLNTLLSEGRWSKEHQRYFMPAGS